MRGADIYIFELLLRADGFPAAFFHLRFVRAGDLAAGRPGALVCPLWFRLLLQAYISTHLQIPCTTWFSLRMRRKEE